MALTAAQSIDRLSGIDTTDDLRDLISQLDVTGTASGVTVLYSGGDSGSIVNTLVGQGEDIRIIDATEAAQFLDLNENTADTIEKLNELINDLDVSGENGTTMLFSGSGTRDIIQSCH